MKETETPDQWYIKRYPRDKYPEMYTKHLGEGDYALWPERTIIEYAQYFMKSSLPSEQENAYCMANANGELLIHTVGKTESEAIESFNRHLVIYTVTQMIQEKGYKIVPIKIRKNI